MMDIERGRKVELIACAPGRDVAHKWVLHRAGSKFVRVMCPIHCRPRDPEKLKPGAKYLCKRCFPNENMVRVAIAIATNRDRTERVVMDITDTLGRKEPFAMIRSRFLRVFGHGPTVINTTYVALRPYGGQEEADAH